MSFEKFAGSSFIAIAMLTASAAQAQEAPAPQAEEQAVPEQESSGDIIVTALRRDTKLRDVPVSITAVNADGLERAGINNLRDLGNLAPGLVFNGQNGLASPTIRGVQSTLGQAGAESPTAIYIDGVYQPNTAANFQDLADVKHVEVLKGPQGTLFGRNATGGAIVIRTVEPSFTPTGSFTVSDGIYTGGSARTSHDVVAKGYIAGPIAGDIIAGSLSGFYEWVDGYLTNDLNGKRTGRIEKYNIRGKLLVEPSDSFKLMIAGFYSHKNDETAFASQPLNGNTNVQFYPDGVVPTKIWHVASPLRNGVGQNYVTTKSVYGKLDWNLGDKIGSITALSSFLKVDAQLIVPIAAAHSPTCVASFNCIIYDEKYPGKTFQNEISFNSGDWGPIQLVAGAMFFKDKNTIFSNINPPLDAKGDVAGPGPVYLVGTVKTKAWAGFGEVTVDATDSLHFLAGLRYSHEKRSGFGNLVARFPSTGPVVDTAWTPRLSVRYDVTPQANVYFTYSKGFKSAVLQSINQDDQGASPEHMTSYEIGAKIGTPIFGLNLAAYYYDYKDLQVQFFDGALTILTNAANARIYGIEGDAHYKFSSNFDIAVNASWLAHANYRNFTSGVAFALPNTPAGMPQVVIDASGERMVKAPKFTGAVTLNYNKTMNSGELTATATYAYVGGSSFDLLRRVNAGGYGTLNASVGFQPQGSDWKFTLFGRNITNEIYFTGSLLGGQADAPAYAPPRQIGLQANYKF